MRLTIAYAAQDRLQPVCPFCKGTRLQRRISRAALVKSKDARFDALMSDNDLD